MKGSPRYKFNVESTSSSPYESGFLDIEIMESGVNIRWLGEHEWKNIEWHEIAAAADAKPPKLSEEIQWYREQAQREGYEDGFMHGSKDNMLAAQERRASMLIFRSKEQPCTQRS